MGYGVGNGVMEVPIRGDKVADMGEALLADLDALVDLDAAALDFRALAF